MNIYHVVIALILVSSFSIHGQSTTMNANLVIIGSGVSGLAAGIQATRLGIKPLIIEGDTPGGGLKTAGELGNWPGEYRITGPELIEKMRSHAEKNGCQFLSEHVVDLDTNRPFTITTADDTTIRTHAIIITSGTAPKKLGCPGEETYWGKGIGICSMCDGAFFENKKVIVVGGGNSALWEAVALTKFTDDVTIIDSKPSFSAAAHVQAKVRAKPTIKLLLNTRVDEIMGNGVKLTHLRVTDLATNTSYEIPTDGLFVAIGMEPQTSMIRGKIELTPKGFIHINHSTQTSVKGIFAAGNVCNTPYKQAIAAAGMGCMAAIDAEAYLKTVAQKKNDRLAKTEFYPKMIHYWSPFLCS